MLTHTHIFIHVLHINTISDMCVNHLNASVKYVDDFEEPWYLCTTCNLQVACVQSKMRMVYRLKAN